MKKALSVRGEIISLSVGETGIIFSASVNKPPNMKQHQHSSIPPAICKKFIRGREISGSSNVL